MSGSLPPLSHYGIRQLRPPLSEAQLSPPEPAIHTVQFNAPLSEPELRRLAAFLRGYPSLHFRVYAHGLHAPVPDLEFLRDFSFLRRFSVDVFTMPNFDGLRHLKPSNVTHLSLGRTKKKRISLAVLEPFAALRRLVLDGHARDFDVVGELKELRGLALRGITVPTLRPLAVLPQLEWLMLSLGGTTALDELANVKTLSFVELVMVHGLRDVSVLAQIRELRHLSLRTLKHVSELPSFRASEQLRIVWLDQMRALTDFNPIADAPGLCEFAAIEMRHLSPAVFAPFVNHPRLESMFAGLSPARANDALHAMFPNIHWGRPTKHPTLAR